MASGGDCAPNGVDGLAFRRGAVEGVGCFLRAIGAVEEAFVVFRREILSVGIQLSIKALVFMVIFRHK